MKTPREVAKALKTIYKANFGGKERGRYKISRPALRRLSERRRLEDTTLMAIVNAAYELGFVLTDLGDDFSVVEVDVMRNYRKVPTRLVEDHLKTRTDQKRGPKTGTRNAIGSQK